MRQVYVPPDRARFLAARIRAMKLKGTTVYPAAVQRALQGIEQVIDYVMIATAPTPPFPTSLKSS